MNQHWTHYWTQACLEAHRGQSGAKLIHTAGNQFQECGVSEGDFVYCLSYFEGSIILIARIKVHEIVSQQEADKRFGESVWTADDHLIALPRNGSIQRYDRIVPVSELRELRFITKKGETRIKFHGDRIDAQALRRVRNLTAMSAKLLDKIIDCTDRKTNNG